MKLLKQGNTGADVKKWQYFLLGQGHYVGAVTGIFGPETHKASVAFQKAHRLQPDGIVGNKTIGRAMQLGFGLLNDSRTDILSENFPAKPAFSPLVTNAERAKHFGTIRFTPNPVPGNRENIAITNNWDKNHIIKINIPQLIPIKGTGTVYFHKKGADQLRSLFADWEAAGLMHHVLTWDGAYTPRFVRGSNKVLSNHAFGTAFDINMAWNRLGAIPALVGQKGSVRTLVQLAHQNGFYWGGHFKRKDGMHFEIAQIR
ncbi:M15 family metallopeptidase [Flavobacterium sp. j3]|uniref:M15 family metallopeptidase n=1 Tax=Flavobacterium aureirubrum TaxID=3133147 RepID=A0ABU9N734_9FLAO